MTLVPENPRSELVMPAKSGGDGVWETRRMFQIAEPASCRPALRPTRGSGDGAAITGMDMSGVVAIEPDDIVLVDEEPAQAIAIEVATTAEAASAILIGTEPARKNFETGAICEST